MPLTFSPLSEDLLDTVPKSLLPKHAFIMRQLGDPPELDLQINAAVSARLVQRGYVPIDANGSVGAKDYLERILGLVRSTGFTVSIFSEQTRPVTLANIALEMGFAAMCGKPILVVKSPLAIAPSDLKRTDWIVFDDVFDQKLDLGLDEIEKLIEYEATLVEVALEARSMDCAIALERAMKGFLLSGEIRFVEAADRIRERLASVDEDGDIGDLERLRAETKTFIRQANAAFAKASASAPASAN